MGYDAISPQFESHILIDISEVLFMLCSRDPEEMIFFLISVMWIDFVYMKLLC
jgi:hypothetical protein